MASPTRTLGVALAAASALFFAMQGLAVSFAAARGVTIWQIASIVGGGRCVLAFALTCTRSNWRRHAVCVGRDGWFVALFAVCQGLAALQVLTEFTALSILPVGESTAIAFSAPIWSALIARLCLREQLAPTHGVAAIGVVVGVALIALNGNESPAPSIAHDARTHVGGLACAVLTAIAIGGETVALRAVSAAEVPAVVCTAWSGLGIFFTAALVATARAEPILPQFSSSTTTWLMLTAGATMSTVAQTLLAAALQMLEAGPVTVLSALEVFFAFFGQVLVMHAPVRVRALAGAILICVSVLVISLHTAVSADAGRHKSPLSHRHMAVGTRPAEGTSDHGAAGTQRTISTAAVRQDGSTKSPLLVKP